MKKIFLILSIFLLCGCSFNKNEYDNFEHYDLDEYRHQTYTYDRENTNFWNEKEIEIETYAFAIISPKSGDPVMGYTEGILYKVGANDYILLDNFGPAEIYQGESYNLPYKDKIYIVRNMGSLINEYTLNKENTSLKELKFNYDSIINKYKDKEHAQYLYGHKIDKVDDEFIYFKDISFTDIPGLKLSIKCSLKNYKCEEYKQ